MKTWENGIQVEKYHILKSSFMLVMSLILFHLSLLKVSALESNVGETLCSLKFAQRVCKVELGPAARKIESGGGQCD